MNTKYKGMNIEFHILQSFPVTSLNRDDVGSPKTAVVGGVTRARVSSQAWKRQIRSALRDFGISLAIRTKYVADYLYDIMMKDGASEEQAKGASEAIAAILTKDTLHFFSETEAQHLARYAKEKNYTIDASKKPEASAVLKVHKAALGTGFKHLDGLDIALFGRMVAQGPDLTLEGASVFAHAISTHKVSNELDFFTALDDVKEEMESEVGSSHMGVIEFNSATYYRYVALDVGQLVENLGGDEHVPQAIEVFIKALYVAVPYARQRTQAGAIPWDFARVYVRKGQRLQASFENPVKERGEGFSKPSREALVSYLEEKEALSGSLFGKIAEFTWGLDQGFSIDDLIREVIAATNQG